MKTAIVTLLQSMFVAIGLTIAAPFVSPQNFSAAAQANRISGYVFGINRKPLDRMNVELLDDFQRTRARTLTSSTGYYQFDRMSFGRFTVRVYTLGTDYEEKENSVELVNYFGNPIYEQSDFQLKLRRGVTPANESVFAQDVPPDAQKLYDKAIDDLQNKRTAEGHQKLRDALTAFPNYYAALERLGLEYIQLGSTEGYQVAAGLLNIAVGINPRGFKSWYGLAYAYNLLQNYPQATAVVEKALSLNQSSVDALFLHGRLLRQAKKYSEAEKQLTKAIELSGDGSAQLHWELALLYGNNLKKYADAARELKLYLKINPKAANAEEISRLIADFEAKSKVK